MLTPLTYNNVELFDLPYNAALTAYKSQFGARRFSHSKLQTTLTEISTTPLHHGIYQADSNISWHIKKAINQC